MMHPAGAIPGGLLWLAFLFILPVGHAPVSLVAPLLLFALLVLAPLIFALPSACDAPSIPAGEEVGSGRPSGTPFGDRLLRFARALHPFAAVSAALSFLLEPGMWAGLFCSFWLLLALALAMHATMRIARRGGRGPLHEVAFDVGMLYLPIGAAWLLAARAGLTVMGFGGMIALLTAVHFHYAGLTAATLAGLAGRQMPGASTASLYRLATPAVLAGPILVALGIAFSPLVEVVAALILATGVALLSGSVLVGIVPHLPSIPARILLTFWGMGSTIAMVLAVLYALATTLEAEFMNIPRMVLIHGLLNASAALAGLMGWRLVYRDATSSRSPHGTT